jgi:hypothetical protein
MLLLQQHALLPCWCLLFWVVRSGGLCCVLQLLGERQQRRVQRHLQAAEITAGAAGA